MVCTPQPPQAFISFATNTSKHHPLQKMHQTEEELGKAHAVKHCKTAGPPLLVTALVIASNLRVLCSDGQKGSKAEEPFPAQVMRPTFLALQL